MSKVLILHGRVFREEGMFHCDIEEIHQFTWGHTLDDVINDAIRAINAYFEACRIMGTEEAELAKLGVTDRENLAVGFYVDAREVFPARKAEQHIEFLLAS